MPETNTGAPEGTDTATSETATETEAGGDTGNIDGLKKALERERKSRREAEQRAKALEPFEKQAKALEDASKSEVQKLTDALNEAKSGHSRAETELLRYRTAAEKGVPLNLVRFLTGSTAEEVAESADLLLKELGTKPTLPGKPREQQRLSTGKPSDAESTEDPMELIKMARSQRV
jgi:membrane-associated HD superfamily phosphohydrolase